MLPWLSFLCCVDDIGQCSYDCGSGWVTRLTECIAHLNQWTTTNRIKMNANNSQQLIKLMSLNWLRTYVTVRQTWNWIPRPQTPCVWHQLSMHLMLLIVFFLDASATCSPTVLVKGRFNGRPHFRLLQLCWLSSYHLDETAVISAEYRDSSDTATTSWLLCLDSPGFQYGSKPLSRLSRLWGNASTSLLLHIKASQWKMSAVVNGYEARQTSTGHRSFAFYM